MADITSLGQSRGIEEKPEWVAIHLGRLIKNGIGFSTIYAMTLLIWLAIEPYSRPSTPPCSRCVAYQGPDAQIRTPGPLWRPLVFQSQGSLPAPRRQTGGGRGHETKMQPLLWWCLMCSMCSMCLMCLMTANGVQGTQDAAARLISWLDGFHRRDPGRSRLFKAVQGY